MLSKMKLYSEFVIIVAFFNSFLCAKALRIRRNAHKDESMRWPKGIVPYNINEAFSSSEREVIIKAMKDIQSVSCVRFKRHSGEKGYVDVVKGPECSATTGYSGRRQKITLGTGCVSSKTVLHELFHALGFCHEHTRPDRDQYVRINKNNIKPEELYNFNKLSSEKYTSFGLPYDYNSVLHYHDKSFAIDRSQKSIEPISGKQVLGTAKGMSKLDILKLNKLYRCSERKQGGKGQTSDDFEKYWKKYGSHLGKKWEKFGLDFGKQFKSLNNFGKYDFGRWPFSSS